MPTATAQDWCLTRRGRFRRFAVARSPPGSRRVSLMTTGSLCPSSVDSPIARPAVGTVSGACDDLAGRLVQFRHGRSRRGCRLDQVADGVRIPQRVVESPIQVGRTCCQSFQQVRSVRGSEGSAPPAVGAGVFCRRRGAAALAGTAGWPTRGTPSVPSRRRGRPGNGMPATAEWPVRRRIGGQAW